MKRPSSVWTGNDKDFLRQALPFYLGREPNSVLDVTWGSGKWWADLPWKVIGMDKYTYAEIRGDYRQLPFRNTLFDVVIFDPPHRSAGGPNRSRLLESKFGSTGYRPESLLEDLEDTYKETYRVLKPGGICLTKMTDQVHWHRFVWHHVAAILAADAAGFTPCDMVVKVRSHGIVSSKWKNAYHALKRHCFWLVFRKGGCEPAGATAW